jgi:hypothetical protein
MVIDESSCDRQIDVRRAGKDFGDRRPLDASEC